MQWRCVLLRLLPLLMLLLAFMASHVACQMQCNGTSRQKHIVIRNPATRELAELPSCLYNVAAWSSQVCQVRIDFDRFDLPQPMLDASSGFMECVDFLQVQRFRLCGRNNGQHLYVPLQHGQPLQLHFNLGTRATQTTWQLTLTQLECLREQQQQPSAVTRPPLLPFVSNFLPRTIFGGRPLGSGPAAQLLHNLVAPAEADLELLAPLGCDQYYRTATGGIVSFNYAGGIYMPNTNYAICVKSTPNSEISYSVGHFALSRASGDQLTGPGFDEACRSTVGTTGRATDYLLIPNSYIANNEALQPTYYCGNELAGTTVRARAPFIIYFFSDALTNATETGFQLSYSVEPQKQTLPAQQMDL